MNDTRRHREHLGGRIPRDYLGIIRDAIGNRYTVDREIGRGGAARVFLGRDPAGTPVALKMLHPELLVSVAADRFLREIRLAAMLDHPNIARLIDSGEHGWVIYYVMSYVEGPTLGARLDLSGPLSIRETLRVARDLLSALDHAHGHGIVHRDVKPGNIVLSEQGSVLLDFGIARAITASGTDQLTRSGMAVGTSHYMSPEQIRGMVEVDHRTDLYALGCVLFECLTGQPPFTAASEGVVLQLHLREPAPDVRSRRPDTPAPVADAIARALAKRPEERFASAAEMRRMLAACEDAEAGAGLENPLGSRR